MSAGGLREAVCALLLEVAVFAWSRTVQLFFWLRYYFVARRRVRPLREGSPLLRPAVQLAAQIRSGEVKSRELVEACIKRIREVQPLLNAVVDERYDEALREARECDDLVASGKLSPEQLARDKPLLGVPFTTKNGVGVRGLRQDGGSRFWKGQTADGDAVVVSRLRAAGAIPLALSNVPELCAWGDTANVVDGRTRNPYDTRRSPGGSSGGEACLLAVAGSLMGVGTDIAGSIRLPSVSCGIFGHKPTAGIVPNDGIFPIVGGSMQQYNCAGPMARFAQDLPVMLRLMTGDAGKLLRLDQQVDVRQLKVYYMEDEGSLLISRVSPEVRKCVRKATEFLKNSQGLSPEKVSFREFQYGLPLWMAAYFEAQGPPIDSFFRRDRGSMQFPQEFLKALLGTCDNSPAAVLLSWISQLSRFKSAETLARFSKTIADLRSRLEAMLGENGVLLMPGRTGVPEYHSQDLFFPDCLSMTAVLSILQFPVTACPVGFSASGLPIGVQVVAARKQDRLCLAVARELQRGFGGWKDPSRVC